ncbi:hypothetical protein LAJPDJIK_00735 [Aeromonas salmonicida]
MGNDQYIGTYACRAIQPQLLDLLRIWHLLDLHFHLVLGFECLDRIFNAIGLLDVFPHKQLTLCRHHPMAQQAARPQ